MEKKKMNMEEQSFVTMPQRVKAEHMEKLFVRAVGDELVEKREEMVKHFDMGANRYQAVIYSEPVHFRESNEDDWQEIDNTLEETVNEQGRPVLRNRANRMHVEFPQQMDGGNMAAITDGGKTFSWRFEEEAQPIRAKIRTGAQLKHERLVKQAQKLPKYVGRTVESLQAADLETEMETEQERRGDIAKLKAENSYENVLPGVSVRYTLGSEKVKEDIILTDAAALKHVKLRLPKNFDYEVTEDKKLLIKEDGKVVFTMDTPFVYDAAGKETIADIILTDCGSHIRLEYVLDTEFMAEAQFPVTIDPTINSTNAVTNIQDTTLGEGQSAKPHTADHLKIGKLGGSVRCVGLLKFNSLAVVPASDTVISAVLQMCPKNAPASNYIGAYEVKKSWEAASTNWASLNPYQEANVSKDALECVAGSTTHWLAFDLTNLYRKWCTRDAAGNSNNNGVAFRSPDNITGNNYSELYSANASSSYRPVMYVNYVSHAGLEAWWQYEQMSAGRAGTVYADLFNGNMVVEHSDTVMTGNRMPVSVNHFYNSCLSSANSYNCGYGWKTDAHQKVTARTHNNRYYLIWEDGDGTEHFFEKTGEQPFKDSEGMDLEMTYTTGSPDYIIITDKQHNQMRFNVVKAGLAWLVATRDAMHNTAVYSYVSGKEEEGRIDYISDPVGRKTQFIYNGNLLHKIQIPAAEEDTFRTVTYSYDSSSRLIGVNYSELGGTAAHTTYGYDGSTKLLTKVRNYDGIQLNVGYEALSLYGSSATDQARHITSLETVATNSSGTVTKRGAKQIFEYGAMTTTVTAVETDDSDAGKKLYYQFNDSGNVICVRDDLGFARFTKFDSNFENKESEVSKLRKAVVNRLRRPDFSSQWDDFATGGTVSKDSTNLCLNCKSVKMAKTGSGETIYRQLLDIEAGTPFTFSAYVKTSALNNGGAFLRIIDGYFGSGNVLATSEVITGSTAAAVGNELPTDGWERIRVTLDAQSEEIPIFAELVCDATSGTAWFACPQLETGSVANTFNLVSNGDFRYTTTSGVQTLPLDWDQGENNILTANTGVFKRSDDPTMPAMLEGNYVQVESRPDKELIGFVQHYDMIGKAGDIFVVGGWADGKSIPNANTREKGIVLALSLKKASDGKWIYPAVYPFNDEWVGWQQNCYAAAAGADYTEIALFIMYTGNCNKAKFTNIFLHREAYGTSFGRDSEGKVLSISNLAGQKSDIKYDDADNIYIYTQPGRDSSNQDNQYWFYYGDTPADRKKHLLWRSRTPMHVVDYNDYDQFGNKIKEQRVDYQVYTENDAIHLHPYIQTETVYSESGNYEAASIDARGERSSQVINEMNGCLMSSTDACENNTLYYYDQANRLISVIAGEGIRTYKNNCIYDGDKVVEVSHNTDQREENDVRYIYTYDELGRLKYLGIGSKELYENVYSNNRNGKLARVEYANNNKVIYDYDEYGRLISLTYNDETSPRSSYCYNAAGNVSKVYEHGLNMYKLIDYDLAGRPHMYEYRNHESNTLASRSMYQYDKYSNLVKLTETNNNHVYSTNYTYDRDNRITCLEYCNGAYVMEYVYDALGRGAQRIIKDDSGNVLYTIHYTYIDGGYGINSTTLMIASIEQEGLTIEYEYDEIGNIRRVTRDGDSISYEYDEIGQLVRVNDAHSNITWVYEYDCGGNIQRKKTYNYCSGELVGDFQCVEYQYTDTNWKDKATVVNDIDILYDELGNLSYDGKWHYEWEAGHRLKRMYNNNRQIQFMYDSNGNRVKKTSWNEYGCEITDYTMHGNKCSHISIRNTDNNSNLNTMQMHFFLDEMRRPVFVQYNDATYFYLLDAQGNVVGLMDENANVVVHYYYDAWGKLEGIDGAMADTLGRMNPYRYHGYIYDEETGLYCLHNRYYKPEWCRFISVDPLAELSCDVLLRERSPYSYCYNDPVSFSDENGKLGILATFLLGAAVSAAFSSVGMWLSGDTANLSMGEIAADIAVDSLIGGVSALAGMVYNPIAMVGFDMLLSAAKYMLYECAYKGEKFSGADLADKLKFDGAASLISNVSGEPGFSYGVDFTATIVDALGEGNTPKNSTSSQTQVTGNSSKASYSKPTSANSNPNYVVEAGTRIGSCTVVTSFSYPKKGDLPVLVTVYDHVIRKYREIAIYPNA